MKTSKPNLDVIRGIKMHHSVSQQVQRAQPTKKKTSVEGVRRPSMSVGRNQHFLTVARTVDQKKKQLQGSWRPRSNTRCPEKRKSIILSKTLLQSYFAVFWSSLCPSLRLYGITKRKRSEVLITFVFSWSSSFSLDFLQFFLLFSCQTISPLVGVE